MFLSRWWSKSLTRYFTKLENRCDLNKLLKIYTRAVSPLSWNYEHAVLAKNSFKKASRTLYARGRQDFAFTLIIQMLSNEQLRGLAVDTLADLKDPAAIPHLAGLLGRVNEVGWDYSVIRALANIGGPLATLHLTKAFLATNDFGSASMLRSILLPLEVVDASSPKMRIVGFLEEVTDALSHGSPSQGFRKGSYTELKDILEKADDDQLKLLKSAFETFVYRICETERMDLIHSDYLTGLLVMFCESFGEDALIRVRQLGNRWPHLEKRVLDILSRSESPK